MNKTKKFVLFIGIACFSMLFTIMCNAETSEKIVSEPITELKMSVEALIEEMVTPGIVKENYDGFTVERPENYTYDLSEYILQYDVSRDYWEKTSTFDYKGITENIDFSHPVIFIPLFGDVADLNGDFSERVIGFIKLYYNSTKEEYKFNMAVYNTANETYKNGKGIHFYESITNYLTESKTEAKQIFMLRHPNSMTDGQETVAVIQTENDTFVLDLANSAHVESKNDDVKPVAYSIEEYRTLRMNAEKTLYQQSEGWEKNPAGGNSDIGGIDKAGIFENVVYYIIPALAVVIIIAVVAVVIIKQRKKNS